MKNNKAEKRVTICIPAELFEKFQQICDANYKSMSESIRDFVKSYIVEYQNNLLEHMKKDVTYEGDRHGIKVKQAVKKEFEQRLFFEN